MKRIMFDIDGVLADFVKAYTTEAARLGLIDRILTTVEQPEWSFASVGLSEADEAKIWAAINAYPVWWYSHIDALFENPQANRINSLISKNEVYFITDRSAPETALLTAQAQTALWLSHYGIAHPCVIPAKDKATVAEALSITHAIDDKPENCVAIAAHVPETYMLTRKYNQLSYFPKRVPELEAFLEICEAP